MDKELLRKNYNDACEAYMKAFCQKHGYDYEEADHNWDINYVEVGDLYIGIEDIRTDIDEDSPEDEITKWYDCCFRLQCIDKKIATPSFHNWLLGSRKSEEDIAALEAAHARVLEAQRMLQEEIDRQEDNEYGQF